MSDTKRLTVEDPIDQTTLTQFAELEGHKNQLGGRLIDIKAEEVKIMVAARRIDEEKQRLFEKVLVDRGLHPSTAVEIEASTGLIRVLRPHQEAPAAGEESARQA